MYFLLGSISILFLNKIRKDILLISSVIFILFSLFSFLSRENVFFLNLYNLFLGFFAFLSAYFLYISNRFYIYLKFIFWAYSLMIFYYFYLFGLSDPDLYNDIFVKGSRNYVSAIYIFILCLLILSYDKRNLKVPMLYPLINFLGCVILYGRSGIIISFSIMMYLYFFNRNYLLVKILLVVLVILGMVLNIDELFLFFIEKTSFAYGIESERTVMINEYINGITSNIDNFLFGVKLDDCCITIKSFDGNPHNSFIAGHIRYGIFHIIFSLTIFLYIILSGRFLYIFISLVFYSRLFADQLGFFSPLDIVIFYIIFLIYGDRNEDKKL